MLWMYSVVFLSICALKIARVQCECRQSFVTVCDSFTDLQYVAGKKSWTELRVHNEQEEETEVRREPRDVLNKEVLDADLSKVSWLTIVHQLKKIEPYAFRHLRRSLYYVNLYDNHLTRLESKAFFQLHLRKLSLRNNNVEEILAGAFQSANIDVLDLSDNKLKILEVGAFANCELLELNVRRNQLRTIQFGSLPFRLNRLHLDENILYELPRELNNLITLSKLTARNNGIYEISNLGRLQWLQVLDLSFNDIKSVGSQLSNLSHLNHVNLSYNKLVQLDLHQFVHQGMFVYLAFNKLSHLNLDNIHVEVTLTLYGNPWNCKCWERIETNILQGDVISRTECDEKLFMSDRNPICVVGNDTFTCSDNAVSEETFQTFRAAIQKLDCDVFNDLKVAVN